MRLIYRLWLIQIRSNSRTWISALGAWTHCLPGPLKVLGFQDWGCWAPGSRIQEQPGLYPVMLDVIPHCLRVKKFHEGIKGGSAVKSVFALPEDLSSIPVPMSSGSHSSVTPAPGDLEPSSDLFRHPCVCTHTHAISYTHASIRIK